MPVKCRLIGGKHRIVGPDGRIEKTANGKARDGGGHDTRESCERQMRAVNSSLAEKAK